MSAARRGMLWESDAVAQQLQDILDAVEAPPIDLETRRTLQRYLWRREKHGDLFRDEFGSDGRGYVTLLVRTVLESEGNQDALIEPIVVAVSSCMRSIWTNRGLDWIAAFDQIPLVDTWNKLRDLNLFDETELSHFYLKSIKRELWRIFGPDVPEPIKVKREPKPSFKVARVPAIERKIALGAEMLALRSATDCNKRFGKLRAERFDVDAQEAARMMRVAKHYAGRPEIYRRLSWRILVELTAPAVMPDARRVLELKIASGQKVDLAQIRRARGAVKRGAPKRRQKHPTSRMAPATSVQPQHNKEQSERISWRQERSRNFSTRAASASSGRMMEAGTFFSILESGSQAANRTKIPA
jgi:hypothetical protein